MATITGQRAYSTQSGRIIQNVLPQIMLIDDNINDAGFLAFFSRVGKETTTQEEFKWDVDNFLPFTDTTSAAVTGTTQTTIPVTTPKSYNAGDLWTNKRTGEIYYVREVNISTANITVTRGVSALESSGGTAAAAILSGDSMVKLAPVVGENSSRMAFKSTTPSEVSNYCQQFRWDLSMSRRQAKRQFETGDELPYQTKKQLKEAQMGLNRAFLAGEKARYTNDDGDDVTLTAGIKNVISTYSWSVGGTMHEYEFDEFLVEEAFRKGSRNKLLFASTKVILALSEMTKDRVEYTIPLGTKSSPVGIKVMEYMAPNGGQLLVTEDRFLSEAYNGMAVGVDMTQLKRKVFSRNGHDDDLHIIPDTQDKDDLGTVSTLFADMGLCYGAEEHHFLITNVEGGAKGRAVA